jgi:hypothetical protein
MHCFFLNSQLWTYDNEIVARAAAVLCGLDPVAVFPAAALSVC